MAKKISFNHIEKLYETKNSDYGNAYVKFGEICQIIWPEGIELKTKKDFVKFGLFIQWVEKVMRVGNLLFIDENINHESLQDSCDDLSLVAQLLKGEL